MSDQPDQPEKPLSPTALEFLKLALERWRSAETAESDLRTEGELDLQFLNLEQWDATIKNDRGTSRPSLTIDQIGEPYRQLVGQFRRAHPGIEISPVDNGADQETAERYQGAIRHIETTGGAKAAREEAFKGAVGPGWGYYRLYADWDYNDQSSDPKALFDQCIKYQAIENQFTVFRDPACPLHEPWKARFCLLIEDIPKEEFKSRWPKAIASSQEAMTATGMTLPDWYPETSVRVADYFYLEQVDLPEVAELEDGSVVPVAQVPAGATIRQKRIPKQTIVKLAKITGAEVIEGNAEKSAGREEPWPFIPVVPMFGESLTVKGKRSLRGIVRAARDPQRMYNYQNSELVYELALAPKSKVIMAEGQDEGYEDMWKNAATTPFGALKYKPTSLNGERVEGPRIAQFTDPAKIQALVIAINQHKADLRSTTGWYDTTDPNRKNSDQSGRAILARKDAQTEGSVNYMESGASALRFEAMLLLGAIPKLYNRPGRGIRIAGLEDDTKSETMVIGQAYPTKDGNGQAFFAWGAGRYDITVDIGASYGTRRQEAASWQLELMKVLPPEMAAAMAPVAVRNMDGPGNKEIADRLDRTLPPNVRGDEKNGKQLPPEVTQAIQQRDQMIDMLTQQLQKATESIKTEEVKRDGEMQKTQMVEDTKLRVAQVQAESAAEKNRVDAMIAYAQLDADGGKVALQEETKRLLKLADLHLQAEQVLAQPSGNGASA